MQLMATTVIGRLVSEGETTPAQGLPILPNIAFAILFVIVWKKVVPNLEKAFAERAAAIEGGIRNAEEAQAQAAAALEQYQAQLREARTEAAKIRDEAKEQGSAIIAEMREQAQAEANRITETAHKQIDAERRQAVVSLRRSARRRLAPTLRGQAPDARVVTRRPRRFAAGPRGRPARRRGRHRSR